MHAHGPCAAVSPAMRRFGMSLDEHAVGARTTGDRPPDSATAVSPAMRAPTGLDSDAFGVSLDEHAVGARTTGDRPLDSAPPCRPQCGLLQLDSDAFGVSLDEHAVGARTTGDRPLDSAPPCRPRCGLLQFDRYRIGATIAVIALALFQPAWAQEPTGDEALLAVAANFAEVVELLEGEFERDSGHSLTFVGGVDRQALRPDHQRRAVRRLPLRRPGATRAAGEGGPGGRRVAVHLRHRAPDAVEPRARPRRPRTGRQRCDTASSADWPSPIPTSRHTDSAAQRDPEKPWNSEETSKTGSSWARRSARRMPWSPPATRSSASSRSPPCSVRGTNPRAAAGTCPPELYAPIRQDAVLLTRAAGNAAARGFLDFLRSARARAVIGSYGYSVE